jgi:hypothetical protein
MPRARLQSAHHDDCSLQQWLAAAAAVRAIGYVLTPQSFRFIAAEGGRIEHPDGFDASQAIELRLCTPQHEWRWLRTPEAPGIRGRAACLTEDGALPPGWAVGPTLDDLRPVEGQLLLTGTLGREAPPLPGWSWMHAPRHGVVPLPLADGEPGSRLMWRLREYIGPAPEPAGSDGNRCVVEERLLGLVALGGSN